jgi:hypothetical protein
VGPRDAIAAGATTAAQDSIVLEQDGVSFGQPTLFLGTSIRQRKGYRIALIRHADISAFLIRSDFDKTTLSRPEDRVADARGEETETVIEVGVMDRTVGNHGSS